MMHHPVQYQTAANITQQERMRTAQASRFNHRATKQSAQQQSLPEKLFQVLNSLIASRKAISNDPIQAIDALSRR